MGIIFHILLEIFIWKHICRKLLICKSAFLFVISPQISFCNISIFLAILIQPLSMKSCLKSHTLVYFLFWDIIDISYLKCCFTLKMLLLVIKSIIIIIIIIFEIDVNRIIIQILIILILIIIIILFKIYIYIYIYIYILVKAFLHLNHKKSFYIMMCF